MDDTFYCCLRVEKLHVRGQKYCGTGKAVNTGDEDFIFTRCHRGYGGVAILWSKCIDPLVKVFLIYWLFWGYCS
jgi:hypothetical protein